MASHFVVSSWRPVYWLNRWSFFELGLKVLNESRGYANIICVAVVVICDEGCCGFVWLIGGAVFPAPDSKPS